MLSNDPNNSNYHSRLFRQPSYYLSHGGGSWSFTDGEFREMFQHLEDALIDIRNQLPRLPRAVVVVSGHWEEDEFTVSTAKRPRMTHDYGGFPEDMYQITNGAPGDPLVAEVVATLLEQAGWVIRRDRKRGFDHGVFSMMKIIFPDADIPIVQLSMKQTLDPLEHFSVGKALSSLKDQNILIIGSGQSFHNPSIYGADVNKSSLVFDKLLRHVLLGSTSGSRFQNLLTCINALYGRYAHLRTDRLAPLLVALGTADEEPAHCIFSNYIMDFATSSYAFSFSPIMGFVA